MAVLLRRLTVAVLIKRFLRTGGAEKYALEVVRRLASDHEVHVFAHEWSFQGPEAIVFHRIPRVCIKPAWVNQLCFSWFCRRAVRHGFDVVHSFEKVSTFDVMTVQSPCFKSSGITAEAPGKRMLGWVKLLVSPHRLAWTWLEREQFSDDSRRRIIAVSEYVKKNVQAQYPLPDQRFRIAYTGVEVPMAPVAASTQGPDGLRARLGIAEHDLVVLFVGTEFKRKGLEALLRGFAKAPRSRFKMLIAGGGRTRHYRKLADRLQIGPEVRFLGLVDAIDRLYAIADVYVLPTLADPCPLAPLEAMAAGVATVMSAAPYNGSAELIRQGEALLLSDPHDPDEIAAALVKLMDRQVRLPIAEKGQQLMHRLTWDRTAAVTAAAYQDVFQQKVSGKSVAQRPEASVVAP